MAGIPESSAGITIGWMQEALGAGNLSGVLRLRNVVVEDIGTGRGHAAEVLLCRLVYDGRAEDGPESVIVKRPSSSASPTPVQEPVALQARIRFLSQCRRADPSPVTGSPVRRFRRTQSRFRSGAGTS